MTSQAKAIVAILAGGVVVLAVLFAVAAVDAWGGNMHDDDNDTYMGLMGSMGDMDSGDMMTHMREMMDDETFSQMQEHMADHDSMPMTSGMSTDGMMHQMMDGMMDHMMQGRGGDHHATTTPIALTVATES